MLCESHAYQLEHIRVCVVTSAQGLSTFHYQKFEINGQNDKINVFPLIPIARIY